MPGFGEKATRHGNLGFAGSSVQVVFRAFTRGRARRVGKDVAATAERVVVLRPDRQSRTFHRPPAPNPARAADAGDFLARRVERIAGSERTLIMGTGKKQRLCKSRGIRSYA